MLGKLVRIIVILYWRLVSNFLMNKKEPQKLVFQSCRHWILHIDIQYVLQNPNSECTYVMHYIDVRRSARSRVITYCFNSTAGVNLDIINFIVSVDMSHVITQIPWLWTKFRFVWNTTGTAYNEKELNSFIRDSRRQYRRIKVKTSVIYFDIFCFYTY